MSKSTDSQHIKKFNDKSIWTVFNQLLFWKSVLCLQKSLTNSKLYQENKMSNRIQATSNHHFSRLKLTYFIKCIFPFPLILFNHCLMKISGNGNRSTIYFNNVIMPPPVQMAISSLFSLVFRLPFHRCIQIDHKIHNAYGKWSDLRSTLAQSQMGMWSKVIGAKQLDDMPANPQKVPTKSERFLAYRSYTYPDIRP